MYLLVILLSLFALPLRAVVVQNDVPTPLFDGRADADSFDDFGSEGATCTPTNVTFVEDPASSGKYAAVFNGTTSILSCGTGLDGLAATGTRFTYIKHSSVGENNFGYLYAKQTDNNNRSWITFLLNTGNGCDSSICAAFTNHNTSNVARNHVTPADSLDVPSDYMSVAFVVHCTSTTVESCTGTKGYINGQEVTLQETTTTGTMRTADDGDTFFIGNRADTTRTFDGRQKRMVVFAEELNKFQIERVHINTLYIDQPGLAPEAVTETDCDVLMSEYNAIIGYDPYERTTGQFGNGNACATTQGIPARQ